MTGRDVTSEGAITRRAVLGLALAGAGAVAGGWLWRVLPRGSAADRRFLDSLVVDTTEGSRFRPALLETPQATRMSDELGRRYLEERGETDADTLAAEVMARLEVVRPWRSGPGAGPIGSDELERRLDEAIAADFVLDDGIHLLDGWYLSQTECRLAALRHLTRDPTRHLPRG